MTSNTDRIEKQILLRAPLESVWGDALGTEQSVWQAISDAREFGSWFGMRLDGPFVAGSRLGGEIVPTTVDPDIAASQKPYEGQRFDIMVDRIEPMRLFSFRWHPYAIDPKVDYSAEPTTLVTFELKDVDGGTLLTVVESGFDNIPPQRRLGAFRMNSDGWEEQMKRIEHHVAAS